MLITNEINIISISKENNIWNIEGEVFFDNNFSTEFKVDYWLDDDELVGLEFAQEPSPFKEDQFKDLVILMAGDFEE